MYTIIISSSIDVPRIWGEVQVNAVLQDDALEYYSDHQRHPSLTLQQNLPNLQLLAGVNKAGAVHALQPVMHATHQL
jgi:hypothetical protein